MNKRLFALLVILMSLSLIGIIFVQAYYINNALETKEEQFTFNVKKALTYTTNQVARGIVQWHKFSLGVHNRSGTNLFYFLVHYDVL